MVRFRILSAALLLAAAVQACTSPLGSPGPDSVATSVAQTLSAVSPEASPLPSPVPTQPPVATPAAELLPHSLYYLSSDQPGLLQVFRLARDGKTVQQITFEPARVDSFDVSPVDGSVAYGSNNQLLLVDANGAGRRVLVDGGPVDQNAPYMNSVGVPVWSPDGKTIAFSHGGLNFYSLDSGTISKVLDNQIDTSAGFPIARELYAPDRYSPDGGRLLVDIGFYEGGTFAIYNVADNTLVKFNSPTPANICCEVRWVPDGSGLYVAGRAIGMVDSGLGYVDAGTGLVSVLLPGSAPDTTYNFAAGPQVGTDGKLYFFFNNLPQIPTASHTPLYLVRSDTDGKTDRAKIKQQAYPSINEVLWAPDASLAVVAQGVADDMNAGGTASVVYPDDRPDAALLEFAQDLHWGP